MDIPKCWVNNSIQPLVRIFPHESVSQPLTINKEKISARMRKPTFSWALGIDSALLVRLHISCSTFFMEKAQNIFFFFGKPSALRQTTKMHFQYCLIKWNKNSFDPKISANLSIAFISIEHAKLQSFWILLVENTINSTFGKHFQFGF